VRGMLSRNCKERGGNRERGGWREGQWEGEKRERGMREGVGKCLEDCDDHS
jgi:hypothetical protein